MLPARAVAVAAIVIALAAASCGMPTPGPITPTPMGPTPSPGAPQSSGPVTPASEPERFTPLIIRALAPDPIPVTGSDGNLHVVYELEVLNAAPRPATLSTVEIMAGGPGGPVVSTLQGEQIVALSILVGDYPLPPIPIKVISPGRTLQLVLEAAFDTRAAVPTTLSHRITADFGAFEPGQGDFATNNFPARSVETGGTVTIGAGEPEVIGPPLDRRRLGRGQRLLWPVPAPRRDAPGGRSDQRRRTVCGRLSEIRPGRTSDRGYQDQQLGHFPGRSAEEHKLLHLRATGVGGGGRDGRHDQVVGLIMIDATPPPLEKLLNPPLWKELLQDPLLAAETPIPGYAAEAYDLDRTLDQIAAAASLPRTPVVLLTAAESQPGAPPVFQKELAPLLPKAQAEFAESIPGARLTRVPKTSHYIQLQRPDVVIDTIRSICAQRR